MTQSPPLPSPSTASSTPSAPAQRTRTPPVFKWLLNERAALAGEAVRLQRELARLQAELPAVLNKLAALDATMASLDQSVSPEAGGTVKAQGQHGPRGALKHCVLDQLKAAGSAGVDVSTLALQVAAALGIELPTKKDFSTFRRDYVYVVLKRAKADGLAEVLAESPGGRVPSVWRWVGRERALSLDALRQLADALA